MPRLCRGILIISFNSSDLVLQAGNQNLYHFERAVCASLSVLPNNFTW
jgi:hypothetical protein